MLRFVVMLAALGACGTPQRDFLGGGISDDDDDGVGSGATVFINYETTPLTSGDDDATQNSSSSLHASAQFLAYLGTDAQRATKLAKITDEVSSIVAGYNVVVTASRPATGPYFMIVVTDNDGSAAACASCISSAPPACNRSRANRNAVGFVFGGGNEFPIHMVTENIVAMLGMFEAIPTSTKIGDCMCYRDTPCVQDWGTTTSACTIGGAQTPLSAVQSCPTDDTTMDESAEFIAAFGF